MNELPSLIISSRDEIPAVIVAVESFLRVVKAGDKEVYTITLALDELLSNMFDHGFVEGIERFIEVSCSCKGQLFEVTTIDNGKKFNCTQAILPDVDIPFNQRTRKIGGMGIHLVKKVMDVFTYRRENDKNIIVIGKYLKGEKQLCN